MAYVTGSNGSGTPPDSSSDTPSMATGTGAGGSSGLDAQQFNLLMAFVQQQQQQQQQQQPPLAPVAPAPVQLPPAVTPQPSALNPPTNVYQQLLIQQLLAQQQQQQQPQPPPRQSPPQQDAAAANFSLQQALAQLQQSQQATPQPQPVAPAPAPAPAQLTQNLFQAQQTINQPGMNVGALLLALQQQQQQQQQVNLITSLLSSLNPSAAAAAFQQPNGLQTAQQAAMPNAALFAPQQQPTPVQDDTKPLLEYIQLLRRHQEQQVQQQQLAAVLAAAVGNPAPAPAPIQGQPPPPVLSSQNSSSSLLASPAPNRPTEAVYVSIPSSSAQPSSTMTDHHSGGHSHSNPSSVQGPSSSGGIPSSRQMSTERILASGQTIEDHISRLISENAAIVEPDQVLLKRRPYNRQNTSNSITSQTSSTGGDTLSAAGSPQSAYGARQNATRSQSLHEPALLAQLRPGATTTNGGSITSGQPIARMLSCKSCNVKFPHEASLERHEARCGKKELLLKQHSQPHLLSSVTSSTSGLTPQQFVQQQQKLQAEHQARISALVGGGAGVAPDVFHNSASHRSPPIKMLTASDRRESKKRLLDNVNFEACPEDQPCNSKSGRPASTSGSGGSHVNGSSTGGSGMPPLGLGYLPKIESMDTELAPKMAKMDFGNYSLSDLSHDVQSANLQQQIFDQPSREVIQDFVTAFRNLPSFTTHGDGQLPGPMNSLFSVGPTEVASMPFIVLDPSPEAKATRESVQLQIAFMERGIEPKPYIVSFALNENQMPPIVDDDVNAAVNRRMLKTLTHYTPICPTVGHPRVTKRGESQFAYYSQSVASPETVEQLFQYLACYSTRPHINDKGYCKYTIAGLADKSTRPIHSSTVSTIVSYHQVKSEYDEVDTLLRARAMFESSNAVFSNHHTVQKPPQQPVQALDLSLGESKHRSQPQKVSEAPTQPSQAAVITANPPAVQQPKPIPLQALQQVNQHSDRVRSCDLASNKQLFPGAEYARIAAKIKPTPRSEEVEVYVRGRGRGRYVCERCGIKCRKPSMLKKHLRSHTNIRPFSCVTCNFSFKTKGNLTKHLYSKGHRKKLEEQGGVTVTSQSQGGFPEMGGAFSDLTAAADLLLPIVSERQKKLSLDIPENDDEEFDDDDEDADDEDEEEDDEVNFALPIKPSNDKTKISHRRFGQENIIYERDTHTPPTLWMLCEEKKHDDWPKPDTERSCHTAPPVFDTDGSAVNDSPPRTHSKKVSQPALMLYPQLPQAQEVLPVDGNDAAKALLTAMLAMTPVLPPAEPNFGFITLQQLTHDASMSQFVDQVKRGNLDSQKLLIDVAKAAASAVPSQQETLVGVPLVAEREILEPLPSSISALSTGGRKRKTTTGSLIGVAEPPPAKQRFLSSSNPQQASTSASSSSSTSAAAAAAATSSTSWSLSCEDCGKRYRKQSDLNIHRETHFIEKSRSKVYTCEVCKCVCRTKVMLQRHKEQGCRPPPPPTTTIINGRLPPGSASTAAVGGGSEPALISLSTPGAGSAFSQPQQTSSGANNLTNFSGMMPAGFANGLTLNTQIGGPMAFSASTSSQVSTSALSASSSSSSLGPGASSGRSFRCTDCNTGFRSHGVLTKHLRSKQHVLKLCYNGILPDYAMALIKENATQLATVDASDCDNARESIKALIDRLRNNQQQQQQLPPAFSTTLPQGTRSGAVSSQSSSSSPTASLECTEQLSALSPTPRVPQQSQSQSQNPPAVSSDFRLCGSSTNNSTKPATLSPVPLVPAAKKNVCRGAEDLDEQPQQPQDYPSPVSTPHPNHLTVDTVGVNGRQTFSGNSLLLGGHLGHQVSRMVVSDVWIPPKGDEIPIVDSSTPVMAVSPASFEPRPPDSVGDGGNTSDATSRSATSTPKNNLRRSSLANGGGGGGGGQQQAAYGPFPQPFLLTMCQVCGAHFDSPMDLQIHFQCEHIRLQDGSYLRCPTSECDKVYPSQDALRTHLVSHYRVSPSRGLLLHPNSDEKDDDLSPTPAMSQSSISPDDILSNGGAASPGRLLTQKNTRTATTAPKNSPGAPEESHTTDSPRQQTSKTYTCPICYDPFADMDALKVHVLGHLEADQGPHQPTH